MTLECVRLKQFSVIQTIYRNVGLKRFFFNFTKIFVCYYCYICIFH